MIPPRQHRPVLFLASPYPAALCLSGLLVGRLPALSPRRPGCLHIEWRFTLIDVGVMLLIILPITLMIVVFMWRYRKSRNADL